MPTVPAGKYYPDEREFYEAGFEPWPLSRLSAVRVSLRPGEISFGELNRARRTYAEIKAHYQRLCRKEPGAEQLFLTQMYQPGEMTWAEAIAHCVKMLRFDRGRLRALGQALKGLGRTPGLFDEPPEPMTVETLRRIARALVDGAFANLDVREHMKDPVFGSMWTPERLKRSPPVRVEYETTTVISGIGEGMSIGRGKNWGDVLGVFPVRPEDPVHPTRMLYIYKENNPYNKRFEQRERMRAMMPARYKKLVSRALRTQKKWFLEELTDDAITAIREALRLGPEEFWRAAKGRAWVAFPETVEMFPDGDPRTEDAGDREAEEQLAGEAR